MEDVVANLAQYQIKFTKYHPTIITLDRLFRNSAEKLTSQEMVEGIPVIRLPYSGSSRYPFCPSIYSLLKEFDLVHVHGVDFFYDFIAITKPLHRKKIIASTHGGFFHTSYAAGVKKIFFNCITRLTSKMYEKVVACSDNDFAIFSQIEAPPRLALVENGVNVEKFAEAALGHARARMIYFGRWSVNKGIPELIELFSKLQQKNPDFSLVIAGRPYDIDAEQLHDLAAKYQVHSIEIIESPTNVQLKSLIASSSYFACLSHHEGFGLAAIEAMSAGLIPILSMIPPFKKIVHDSQLGFLIDTAHDESRVTALSEFLSKDTEKLIAQKKVAANFAEQYSWTNVAKKYMDLYE